MRRNAAIALFLLGLLVGVALAVTAVPGVLAQAPSPAAPSPTGDVVMMSCKSGASGFPVSTYRGSAAAPAKKTDSCPQTLADLARDGFTIRHIGHNEDADLFVYTLAR